MLYEKGLVIMEENKLLELYIKLVSEDKADLLKGHKHA